MLKIVDARGFSCPQPVLMTLDEIKSGRADKIIVLVDSDASKENVSRAAENRGWKIDSITEEASEYHITLKNG